jgi:hypothetical protein
MAKQIKVGYSYKGAKGFRNVPSNLEDFIFFES